MNRKIFDTSPLKLANASEKYKNSIACLSANIINNLPEKSAIAVIGAEEKCGATSIVCALAEIMSSFKKVLLIDANFVNPEIGRMFNLNSVGLSEILIDKAKIEEAIIKYKDNLDIITCGKEYLNASQNLFSGKLLEILNQLDYDYILIDTANINDNYASGVIASLAKNALLVVEGLTPKKKVQKAFDSLDILKIKVLGMILNKKNSSK